MVLHGREGVKVMKRVCAFVLVVAGCSSPNGNEQTDMQARPRDVWIQDASADTLTEQVFPSFPEAHVLFDLLATPVLAPFPYDYYLEPGSRRIILDGEAFSNALLPLVDSLDTYVAAAAQMVGFATYAPIVFLTSVPLDASSLPNPETPAEEASVRLIELGHDGQQSTYVPIRVEYREMESQDGKRYLVTAYPEKVLVPGARYLLVVTDGLRSSDGNAFGMSLGFAEVLGLVPIRPGEPSRVALIEREKKRLAPLVLGLPYAARVIAAADFTTGNGAEETIEILKMFWKGGKYSSVKYDLDGDGDGIPDIFFGNDYTECPAGGDELAYAVAGAFEPINFTGPNGEFVRKSDGEWETFESERVRFWLMVPKVGEPAPVVLLVHGIDADHSQLCGVARDFAKAGLASLRFDLPRHGARGGGAMDFLDLTRPGKVRDNMRQAAVDLACACLLLESLAERLDLLPLDEPDGVPEFDASKIGFLGHSLGGMIGSVFVPLSDRVGPAVFNVAGVGLTHMVESYVLPNGSGGVFEIMGMVHIVQHLLYLADGVSFAHQILSQPLSYGHPLLLHEHIGDETMPNRATELLARLAGVPLLDPYVKMVPGLEVLAASKATSGLWQVDGVSHGAFVKSPENPKIQLTRRQAAHFLRSATVTGKPEILYE